MTLTTEQRAHLKECGYCRKLAERDRGGEVIIKCCAALHKKAKELHKH